MVFTLRNLLAFFFATALIFSGKVKRACRRSMKGEFILSIYFHNPSKGEFESMVKWLLKNKFHFISLAELERIIKGLRSFPKGAVILTVDDGWASNENNIVEVAKRYGIPVTIFVATEPIEIGGGYWWSYGREAVRQGLTEESINDLKKIPNRDRLIIVDDIKRKISLRREAMTIDQIRRISQSDLITIGGHSHSHAVLTSCTAKEMEEEITHSKEKLTSWIGRDIEFFAYPNGDFSQREIEMLKKVGYKFGFANNPRYLTREALDKRFQIPRFGFLEGASFSENICRMTGVWTFRESLFKNKS